MQKWVIGCLNESSYNCDQVAKRFGTTVRELKTAMAYYSSRDKRVEEKLREIRGLVGKFM